jgi:hypothetical protein
VPGRPANIPDLGLTNVIFSFVMGLLIATFGMYGRVSSKISHDNPYWRRGHPEQAAREREAAALPAGPPEAVRPLAARAADEGTGRRRVLD